MVGVGVWAETLVSINQKLVTWVCTDRFGTLKNVRGYQGTSIGDHFGIANLFIAGEAPGLFFGYKTQGIIQPEDIVDGKLLIRLLTDQPNIIPVLWPMTWEPVI